MEQTNIKTDAQLIDLGIRYPLLNINRAIFEKTPKERRKLKALKFQHKRSLIQANLNPKKRMNVTAPQHLKFTVS